MLRATLFLFPHPNNEFCHLNENLHLTGILKNQAMLYYIHLPSAIAIILDELIKEF
jgi:hypothetical protein